MALTTATKTLVDATAVSPDSAANALLHGGDHKAIHAALKEVYGIRRYKALLTQSGTSAPVATVLENTFVTTPVWARSLAGAYSVAFGSGEAPTAKTVVTFPSLIITGASVVYTLGFSTSTSTDYVGIFTMLLSSQTLSDDALLNVPIVIEVYP